MTLLAWFTVALAGLAIGATSIGGVLVVPAITAWLGVPLPEAIAASSLAFLVTGLISVLSWRAPHWRLPRADTRLLVGALVGAAAGAALAAAVPGSWLRVWIGGLALLSGLQALRLWQRGTPSDTGALRLKPGLVLPLGLLVGAGSALSGTGGPVMLLPLLLLMRQPMLASVTTAQAIQIPIALSASATHLVAGRIDGWLGAALAGVLLLGALAGRALARRTGQAPLLALTGTVLAATGVWLLIF